VEHGVQQVGLSQIRERRRPRRVPGRAGCAAKAKARQGGNGRGPGQPARADVSGPGPCRGRCRVPRSRSRSALGDPVSRGRRPGAAGRRATISRSSARASGRRMVSRVRLLRLRPSRRAHSVRKGSLGAC
jgi:hypothetical protein